MKKYKFHKRGEAISPPLTYKQGPPADGINHIVYPLGRTISGRTNIETPRAKKRKFAT